MRIGATLLFKDGHCFQSYGWHMLRPLGKLQNALDHLDKYEVDEICIIRPVREKDRSFDSDVKRLKDAKSSTPLSFGGGIRSLANLELLDGMPVERFVVSSALFNEEIELIERVHSKYGKQSIVGFIPFSYKEQLKVFNSSENCFQGVGSLNLTSLKLCDEVVLHDCDSEGSFKGFNEVVVDQLEISQDKLIYSGGVSEMSREPRLCIHKPKSILIENKILHKENSKKTFYDPM